MLVLTGEQGTAKSTTARVVRRAIDPSEIELKRPPRNTEDLMIAAVNGHVITVDNVSELPDWLSDDLAALATDGGLSKRQLYSDQEESLLRAQRPIIVNGIAGVVTRDDLLDRSIVLTLPVIRDRNRRQESEFWAAFDREHPVILGALLDAVVEALRSHEAVDLPRKPRMADFAVWAVAAEPACPWAAGSFIAAYVGNREEGIDISLGDDPLAEVVRVLVPWEGTASDLLRELNLRTPLDVTRRKDWYSGPRAVADALRRLSGPCGESGSK